MENGADCLVIHSEGMDVNQWLKYTFGGAGTLLTRGPAAFSAFSGDPMTHDSPPAELLSTRTAARSLRQVVKGHTLRHSYTANNVKTII